MNENYFVSMRKLNKEKLLNFIKEHKDIPREKLIAIYSNNTGFKMSTIEVYLRELEAAGQVE